MSDYKTLKGRRMAKKYQTLEVDKFQLRFPAPKIRKRERRLGSGVFENLGAQSEGKFVPAWFPIDIDMDFHVFYVT